MAQKLSPKAAAAKKKRDLAAANSDDRKAKRADSQKKRREAIKKHGVNWLVGKDYDHNTGRFTSSSHNRGGTQCESKKDGTKAEKKQSRR
jgi:hypothetical protein|tara:strand:- start:236 stop:505 length:270 start_codon:yes stop_codon:yes gene_type:complete